jgi:hypothetical protein
MFWLRRWDKPILEILLKPIVGLSANIRSFPLYCTGRLLGLLMNCF